MEILITNEQATQMIAELFLLQSFVSFEEIALKSGLDLPAIVQIKSSVEKELRKRECGIRLTSMMHTVPAGIFVET